MASSDTETGLLLRKIEDGENPTDGTSPITAGVGIGFDTGENNVSTISIADEVLARLVQEGRDDPDDQNILGFGTTLISGFSTVNITVNPQRIFKPNRLLIPENVANSFMVVDLRVGKNSQFISAMEIPAMTFGEHSKNPRIKMDTCMISMNVTLVVRNITNQTREFTASLIGQIIG